MLSSALLSLGVASSALAWPNLGHSRHSSIARAIHSRQEPAAPKTMDPVAATWFASWHASDFSLANVSWDKYTTVSYSFALTTSNVSFVNISDPEVFKDFVSTAHSHNVSAAISISGWTGSRFFSSAVATAENRTEFVKTMVNLFKDNNLDRLDFDWEYPNADGVGCNTKSPNDTTNFLLFLKELRTALPNATLSAATSIVPWTSADGTPSTNVSEFASVLDYIAIMNYDIWGSWSDTTGPNGPLNDTCAANATQKVGSAVSAIAAWTKAGFPADQIVLGVPSYGHSFAVASADALQGGSLNPYSKFNKSSTPTGDAWDNGKGTLDVCGNVQAQAGTWDFWGLIEGGFLNENGTANTAGGIVYKYDECSQTPFVYNATSGVLVSFDNAASFTAKGKFINSIGLRGFSMWEAGGDFDDILIDAIRSGAGFPEVTDGYDDCEDDETGNSSGTYNSGGSGSYNSGSGNSNSGSSNSSGNSSGSTSTNTSSSTTGNTSGNTSSNSSSNNSGSSYSGGNSSNNSGSGSSNNSGNYGSPSNSSNQGSTPTTPSYNGGNGSSSNPVPSTTAPQPTSTAGSGDDDECEDDGYPEPETTTTANSAYSAHPASGAPTSAPNVPTTPSTSAALPAATPEPTGGYGGGDDDCEDDETTSVTSSGPSSTSNTGAANNGTVPVTSANATAPAYTSAPAPTTPTGSVAPANQSASYAQPTATESTPTASEGYGYEPPSTPGPASAAEVASSAAEPTLSISPAEPSTTGAASSSPPETPYAASASASTASDPAPTYY